MAAYLPIYKPGQAVTLKASAAVTGGQVVAVSGVGTVAPAAAGSASVVGVAGNDGALNDNIVIYAGGVQNVLSSGAVTAGDQVVAGAAGTVATASAVTTPTAADVNTSRAILGVALTSGTNALVRVQFAR